MLEKLHRYSDVEIHFVAPVMGRVARIALLPPFLVGFLLVGAVQTASLMLTAASMAGIGLG